MGGTGTNGGVLEAATKRQLWEAGRLAVNAVGGQREGGGGKSLSGRRKAAEQEAEKREVIQLEAEERERCELRKARLKEELAALEGVSDLGIATGGIAKLKQEKEKQLAECCGKGGSSIR